MTDTDTVTTPGPRLPDTMLSWRQRHYGGPEALNAETVPLPAPGKREVLLRVAATSLNAADVHVLRGDPLLLRLFFGIRRPRVAGRGMDVAGTVVALGTGVDGVAVGDAVVGQLPGGGLAEYAIAPAKQLVPRPAGVRAVDAAALPIAAGTAWQALELIPRDAQRILVIGASGGVGTFTVQLAAERGAEVWALCGERSRELVAGLGATETFDYRHVQPGSLELGEGRFDAVIDIAGTAPLRALRRLVRRGGTVVLVSGEGGRVLGPIGRMLRAAALAIGSSRRIRLLAATAKPALLRELIDLVADGRLHPVIERTFSLDEARDAVAHIDAGHTVGKVVVRS